RGESVRCDPRHHAFSPDGKTVLIAAGADVHVRDVATGRPRGEPLRQDGPAAELVWSPDSRRAVIVSKTQTQLWDVQRGQRLGAPIPSPARRTAPVFDERGSVVAVHDQQASRVVVWNAVTGERVGEPAPTVGTLDRIELKQGGGLLVLEY